MCVYIYISAYGRQRLTSGVIPQEPPILSVETESLISLHPPSNVTGPVSPADAATSRAGTACTRHLAYLFFVCLFPFPLA